MRDPRLLLVLALALLAGSLAYQAPAAADLSVGWLGDQLMLPSSQGLGENLNGSWYGDELTPDAQSGRSRWTRRAADVTFPGLNPAGSLELTVRAQGWPADALNPRGQPDITLSANGVAVGTFRPTPEWANYRVTIPAEVARAASDLNLTIAASDVFTSTRAFDDARRPKGIRVERIALRGAEAAGPLVPPLAPLLWLALNAALAYLVLSVLLRRRTPAFVGATLLVSVAALALALARIWAAALLPWLALALLLLLLLAARAEVLGAGRRLLQHYAYGDTLNYGMVAAAAAWLGYIAIRALALIRPPTFKIFRDTFPDSLLFGALAMGLLLLVVVRGRDGLPRLSQAIVGALRSPRGAAWLLAVFAAVWIGYEAVIVATLPYVGHADYADNAVVARNLAAGRGWVVDYVTQYYQLYNGVTRPQETWPLLQPALIAPFFVLFGPTDWAAKIPNLIAMTALAAMIYTAGARIWDRRVGVTAAVIILTSQWFFFMAIQTTSDLAFVVFAFGAIYLLYRCVTVDDRRVEESAPERPARRSPFMWRLLGSAVLTGLMLLQKPGSGVLIAAGMGLWLLADGWRAARRAGSGGRIGRLLVGRWSVAVLWGAIALAILSPYIIRNLSLFGTPFYSTESRDAWVLEYGDWEDIYRIFTPEAGLSETGGLPDRSWILRWGFDGTLRKLSHQVIAVRDYLVPPWSDLPLALSNVISGRKALLFPMGAWLGLLGALGALRRRGRLMALLLAAFVPYTLFLIVYWHANEERYFVVVLPWLALLGAYALWRGYDRIAAIGDGRWTPVGLALAVAALVVVIQPSWPGIAAKVEREPVLWAPDLDAYAWLRTHTAPDDVIMTRGPWQLNWHSERPALMVPNTGDRERFLRIARYYNARYLVRDTLSNPSRQTVDLIDRLIEADVLQEVYVSPTYLTRMDGRQVALSTEIYRFPENYGGVAGITP